MPMPYFARIFSPSEAIPPLDSIRLLAGQYAATVTTPDEEAAWETAELLYDEEEAPVDIERYLPATDGLFEEDLNDIRATVEQCEGPGVPQVMDALEECRQIVAFRVPDDADDTVWGPLNAAMDAVTGSIGGIAHADGEGFYEGQDLVLATE
jgi:hypothetical protein